MPDSTWHHVATDDATPSWLESLPALLHAGFSAVPGWGEDDVSAVELALSEIATNVVEHGSRTASGEVPRARLEIVVASSSTRVVLEDDAEPVDLDLALARMPDVDAESGRGLALVRLVTDAFTHTQTRRGNRWCFTRDRTVQVQDE